MAEEEKSLEWIASARKLLKISLESSKAIGSSLDRTGSRLDEIHRKIPSLEAAINSRRFRFSALADHLNHVISLAAAVPSILGSVHELKVSIFSSDQCSDLLTYVSAIKRLEEVLKFLGNSSRLAIKWLEDILELLSDSDVPSCYNYVSTVQKCITILQDIQADGDDAHAPGGLIGLAFDRLEARFRSAVAEEAIPENTIQKLQVVVQMLQSNNRLMRCLSHYIRARSSKARGSMEALRVSYLEKPITKSNDAQEIEGYVELWIKHLQVAVNDVLEHEQTLCHQVFGTAGGDVSSHCFAKIASRSKIIPLIQFGLSITTCKKDPNKLLKLLNMFDSLNSLRLQFNKLFPGEESSEIRALTRDLVTRLVHETCEIFWELPYQVKLHRQDPAPEGGSIPWLLGFVTDYLNQILGSHYRPILKKVLEIHQSWKYEKYSEELLVGQAYNILKEIAVNLDSWSKVYQDKALCYIFMMNSHSHFGKLKGTELGSVTGDKWLQAHEGYRDYYAAMYLRETFGRLQGLLGHSKGKSDDPEVIKKALVVFDEALDRMIKKQSGWVVADEMLRQKICQLAVQALVPAYERCLQSYVKLQGDEDNYQSKQVSQRVSNLEIKLKTLFLTKMTEKGSAKRNHLWGQAKGHEHRQFRVTLAAT